MRVYLAGPFSPYGDHEDWRDDFKEGLQGFDWHDPRQESDQSCSGNFTRDDLDVGIGGCDIFFGYNPKGNYSIDPFGLCVELGYAYAKNKTIVLCDENDWVFSMFPPMTKRLFTSFSMAKKYFKELRSSPTEFEAFYRTISPNA